MNGGFGSGTGWWTPAEIIVPKGRMRLSARERAEAAPTIYSRFQEHVVVPRISRLTSRTPLHPTPSVQTSTCAGASSGPAVLNVTKSRDTDDAREVKTACALSLRDDMRSTASNWSLVRLVVGWRIESMSRRLIKVHLDTQISECT